MASARENVPLAPQPLPRQTSRPRPPPPPQRPKMASGATEPPGSGVLKCSCFYLPSRSKKQKATKLSSASRRSAVAPDVLAASQSQRVTFLASASLSTWWPPSPSAAPAGLGGGVLAPRRASTSAPAPLPTNAGTPRALSSSFSHWRRPQSSGRVMPHGARASFSFPTSPASASSSGISTPKIPQGCQQK